MPLNLLIIDDDAAVTEMLSLLLRAQGFEVMAANQGAEGLALVHEKSPDLIILDLMMPEMDGWAVCKDIRSFSNVPIIVLSALNDPEMIASILDAGADDYLTKPTISAVLVAHIRKLLRRSATAIPSPLEQQRLRLSPRTGPLAR